MNRRVPSPGAVASSWRALHLVLLVAVSTSFHLPSSPPRSCFPIAKCRGASFERHRPTSIIALNASPSPAFEPGDEVAVADDDGATYRSGVIEEMRGGGWYTVRLVCDSTRVKRRRSQLRRRSEDGADDDAESPAIGSANDGASDENGPIPEEPPVDIVDLDSILRMTQQYTEGDRMQDHLNSTNQTISANTIDQITHCHSHHNRWVIFSDLHVMPSTLATCLQILDKVHETARQSNAGILFLGDFWHHRGFVRVDCLNAVLDALSTWTVPCIMIPGNHDQVDWKGYEHALTPLCNAYRIGSSIEVNGENERYPGPLIVSRPTKFLDALFVPHIRDKSTMKAILMSKEAASSSALFVHADVKGASMNDLIRSEHGLAASMFPSDKHIYSGHFHKPHVVGVGSKAADSISIRYVGSPYQTSFSEAGQAKSLLVVDARRQWRCIEEIPIDVGSRHHRISSVQNFLEASSATFRGGDKVSVAVVQPELEEMRVQAATEEGPVETSLFDAKLDELREAGVSIEIRDAQPQSQEGVGVSETEHEREIELEDLSPRATLSAYLDNEVENGELGEATAKRLLDNGQDLLKELLDADAEDSSASMESASNDAAELEIESVSVLGFGSFRHEVEYPLKNRGVVLLRGTNNDYGSDSNGAGKSTLAMASLWSIAGSIDPRPAQDGKVADVVNDFSKVASVTVRGTLNSKPFLVKRTKGISSKGSSLTFVLDGSDMTRQSSKDTQALIDQHFGSADMLMRTVFHGQHAIGGLLESSDARLKDELSYLISLEIWQQSASLARSKQRELMRKVSEFEGMLVLRGKDRARSEEKREAAKSESERREIVLENERLALLQEEDGDPGNSDISSIEGAMESIQSQLRESSDEINRLEEDLSQLMESGSSEINELKSKLQETATIENDARATLHSCQRKHDQAVMELKSAERQLSQLQAEWSVESSAQDVSPAIPSLETCRTCGQPIKSSSAQEHVKKNAEEKLNAAMSHVDRARESVDATALAHTQAQNDADAQGLKVQSCEKALRKAEEALSRETDVLRNKIREARLLQSQCSNEFASLVRKAKEASEQRDAKSRRQANLDRLNEAFQASVVTYESRCSEFESIEANIAELEKEKEAKASSAHLYASLADVFGPKGIQAFILRNIVQALQHCSQTYLDELSDGSLQLRMEVGPNDSIIKQAAIRNPYGTWRVRPLSSLSGGQWRRCSLSLSLGFIHLASTRGKLRSSLLVLDEPLTHLDSAGRKSVGQLLRNMLRQNSNVGTRLGKSGFGLSTILVILQEIAAEEIEECFDQIDEVIKRGGESFVVLDENTED